jgi:hypothetical protein
MLQAFTYSALNYGHYRPGTLVSADSVPVGNSSPIIASTWPAGNCNARLCFSPIAADVRVLGSFSITQWCVFKHQVLWRPYSILGVYDHTAMSFCAKDLPLCAGSKVSDFYMLSAIQCVSQSEDAPNHSQPSSFPIAADPRPQMFGRQEGLIE